MEPEHLLILLRHGKSDWSGVETDRHRPLAKRGRRQAGGAGRWLAANVHHIDLAVVSPAERARSTWSLASAEVAVPTPVRVEERVYAGSGSGLLRLVRELPEELHTVVLVGHNPGLEDLLSTLTGGWCPMPTSALAVVALSGPWADAARSSAQLRTSGRPPA